MTGRREPGKWTFESGSERWRRHTRSATFKTGRRLGLPLSSTPQMHTERAPGPRPLSDPTIKLTNYSPRFLRINDYLRSVRFSGIREVHPFELVVEPTGQHFPTAGCARALTGLYSACGPRMGKQIGRGTAGRSRGWIERLPHEDDAGAGGTLPPDTNPAPGTGKDRSTEGGQHE